MSAEIRVGIVDYLNSRPLAWDFLRGRAPAGFKATYLPPAQVADALRDGHVDVGLVPSIEIQRIPGLRVLAGPCVAAQEEVRSVLLVSKVSPQQIRRVSLDQNSRTSAALVRVLLAECYGCEPEFSSARPRLEEMLSESDAALIIGDPALKVSRESHLVLDLAQEWRKLTGLPFVFAVWAVRNEVSALISAADLTAVFTRSLAHGLEEVPAIAREAAVDLDFDEGEIERYLTKSLSYNLGDAEHRSLGEFYRRAQGLALIDAVRPVELLR